MFILAQERLHRIYTSSTDHLLYACKHSGKNKALRSEVDDTEEQSVKDQQRGLISIKQDITERVGLICRGESNYTSYK